MVSISFQDQRSSRFRIHAKARLLSKSRLLYVRSYLQFFLPIKSMENWNNNFVLLLFICLFIVCLFVRLVCRFVFLFDSFLVVCLYCKNKLIITWFKCTYVLWYWLWHSSRIICMYLCLLKAMNPSIQANIWGMIGKVTELLDTVLDCFLKVCWYILTDWFSFLFFSL